MPKVTATTGKPIIHFWGRLLPVSHGGTTESEKLRKHPRVRQLISTFFGADQTYYHPLSPSSLAGLNRRQQVARRLRERIQDEVATGATEDSLAIFIQKAAEDSGAAGTSVDLFKSQDDAVGVSDSATQYNAVYTAKAINGTLTVQSDRLPIRDNMIEIAGHLSTELFSASLNPPGKMFGDDERFLAPEYLCRNTGGTWTANVADPRAETEIICRAIHAMNYVGAESASNLTFDDWIAEEVARNPSFAPIVNQNWNSTANVTAGNTAGLARLKSDSGHSAWAEAVADAWKTNDDFINMKIGNYEMSGWDNPNHLMFLYAGGGGGDGDHLVGYFGLDLHCPHFYSTTNNDYSIPTYLNRFHPGGGRQGPGRNYDEVITAAAMVRAYIAIRAGSEGDKDIAPWIRGIETVTSPINPPNTIGDMAKDIKRAAFFGCLDVIIWYQNNDPSRPVDFPSMLAAVEQVCPEWVWNGSDWEAA